MNNLLRISLLVGVVSFAACNSASTDKSEAKSKSAIQTESLIGIPIDIGLEATPKSFKVSTSPQTFKVLVKDFPGINLDSPAIYSNRTYTYTMTINEVPSFSEPKKELPSITIPADFQGEFTIQVVFPYLNGFETAPVKVRYDTKGDTVSVRN